MAFRKEKKSILNIFINYVMNSDFENARMDEIWLRFWETGQGYLFFF
jgi:hypothetical protein